MAENKVPMKGYARKNAIPEKLIHSNVLQLTNASKLLNSAYHMKKLLFAISFTTVQLCNAQITLIGMSSKGGFGNHGTIFSIGSSGNIETLLNFNEGTNGCSPHGGLVQDSDGSLYGVASGCGANGTGTLIRYNGEYHGITKLVDFHGAIGAGPTGNLIIGADGNLYGMTNAGGANDVGTIFKCTTDGQIATVASFSSNKGTYPMGSLVQDKWGNLYGMTRLGGQFDKGVVFKCSSTGTLTVLHNFNGDDGSQPGGNIIVLKDTLLYALTPNGGTADGGTVFVCTASGKYTTLSNLDNSTGTFPTGSLLNGGDGYLYGTTAHGGAQQSGTLFRCNEAGKVTVLVNFNDTNGANPEGSLILASDGNIYGTTRKGGGSDAGVVFKYNVASGHMESVCEFSTNGAQMAQGGLIEMKLNSDLKSLASSRKIYRHNQIAKRGGNVGMGE